MIGAGHPGYRPLLWVAPLGGLLAVAFLMRQPASRTYGEMARVVRAAASDIGAATTPLTTPGSGRSVLPPRAAAAIALLRAAAAPDFRLSARLRDVPLIAQRVAEGAWPLPLRASSHFLVASADEVSGCTRIGTMDGIAIDHCD